ncbi:MAG TPA: hypothetical protein VGC00_09685 [Thermoanaerobaculia bacterium]|jgi:hypothetical protein
MPSLAALNAYARFAAGLPRTLRTRIDAVEADGIVRDRLARRAEMLVELVERRIYAVPGSPYRELLHLVGCELGDLRRLVAAEGVEGALGALRDEGVYVTFEEFKGRVPIVRGGLEISTGPRAFDNPVSRRYWHGATSGSTGRSTRIALDLEHLAASVPSSVLALATHGALDLPAAVWRTILPGLAGISNVLHGALRRQPIERWFSPLARADLRPSLKNRLATEWILAVGRLSGARLPRPELVPLDRAGAVARWIGDALGRRGGCTLHAHVSCLLRSAQAASELGIDLSGAIFWGGGEPPTPAKIEPIRAAGARYVPTYFLSEAGAIGYGCRAPADATDVHVVEDSIAVIQQDVAVPASERVVPAFCLTTLLPTSPKLLFNVESDDYGILEERDCGCPLAKLGYRRHIRQVRSYRKLTGEGMSLVGSDMVRVLEQVLPAAFGGTPLDYQLVEAEDGAGFTRLALRVHPRIELPDDRAVVETLLAELGRGDDAAELARAVWRQAKTLGVWREPPCFTALGKFMPLVRADAGARAER